MGSCFDSPMHSPTQPTPKTSQILEYNKNVALESTFQTNNPNETKPDKIPENKENGNPNQNQSNGQADRQSNIEENHIISGVSNLSKSWLIRTSQNHEDPGEEPNTKLLNQIKKDEKNRRRVLD